MKTVCLFLCVVLVRNEAARILAVLPASSISHQVVFRPLTQELARRGHDVTVITPDPVFPKGQTPANFTEIDVHDISYDIWRKTFISLSKGKQNDLFTQMQIGVKLLSSIFFAQIETSEVQEVIHDNKGFDLIFTETCSNPALVFSHIFKAPLISISSFGAVMGSYEAMGVSAHPFLYPSMMRQRIYNLTLWEKFSELYNYYHFENFLKNQEEFDNEMLKEYFGNNTPTLRELRNNMAMLFVNLHPIFEGNVPVPPSVIHMWGIHQKPQKELPQDLKSYLDSSKHGVIYMSFGTNMDPSNLPPDTIQMFIRVFSQLPYDVLWKWNKDELPGKSQNIKIGKWFPQSDLLRHPKIKLFITQGGLQSTDEAITAGVPLVGIPMLGDQWYNTEKYVHLRIGVKLNVETLTNEELRSAITNAIEDKSARAPNNGYDFVSPIAARVLDNEPKLDLLPQDWSLLPGGPHARHSYKTNIKKLDALMRDQPMQPLERAVWWTEHVLRHGGGAHLRAPAANISWAEYLEIELVSILLLGLLVILSIGALALYYVYKLVLRIICTNVKLKKK